MWQLTLFTSTVPLPLANQHDAKYGKTTLILPILHIMQMQSECSNYLIKAYCLLQKPHPDWQSPKAVAPQQREQHWLCCGKNHTNRWIPGTHLEWLGHIQYTTPKPNFIISWNILVHFESDASNKSQRKVGSWAEFEFVINRNRWKNILQLIRLTDNRPVIWLGMKRASQWCGVK